MIIMINGSFGVGKTTVSNKLLDYLDNSMIYDPEEIGYMLKNIIKDDIKHDDEKTDDFQSLELWRTLTVKVAEEIKRKYNKNLIIPMTIRNYDYFSYIIEGLKNIDEVYHFCLIATKENIHKRLLERGDEKESWAFQQTDKCIENYSKYDFGVYINTNDKNIDTIFDMIVNKCPKLKTIKKITI